MKTNSVGIYKSKPQKKKQNMSRLTKTSTTAPVSDYSVKFDILPKPQGMSELASKDVAAQNTAIENYLEGNKDWLWQETKLHVVKDKEHFLYSTPHMNPSNNTCDALADYLEANELSVRATIVRNGRDSEHSLVQVTPSHLRELAEESQIGIPFKSASEDEHGTLFMYATKGKLTDTKYKVEQKHDLKLRFEC